MKPSHAAVAPRRPPVAAALALLVLVALVYVPGSLRNGFACDDTRFIVDNPYVTHPAGWRGWLAFLHDPNTVDPVSPHGIVRPLRTLELALDHALFGLSPVAYHLHSLLWHASATVLLLLLLHRLVGRVLPAALGAAVWALHPAHVEAVAWISSRGDVAMGACVLAALLVEVGGERSAPRIAGALVLGALAMLYKETAVVLPLLVFALRLAHPRTGAPGRIVPALRAAIPYALLAAGYLAYRGMVQIGETAHAGTFVLGGSTVGTFSTMFRGIGAYVVAALLPVRADFDWYLEPTSSLLVPSALAWLGVLVTLVVAAVTLRRREPLLSAAVCMFLFPLIPVANWPFQIGIPTAERFLYVSLAGLAFAVARAARARAVLPAAAVAALALGTISYAETADWHDDTTLMRSALRHDTSPRAHSWFAAADRAEGVALEERAARATDPAERARLLAASRATFERGLVHAHRSLALWHRFEMVSHSMSDVVLSPHINAANIALFLELPREALWHADRAIAANESYFPEAHYNRAIALSALGRPAEAIRAIERAFELGTARNDATMIRTAVECGQACRAAGAFDDARRAFRLVRGVQPEIASRGLASVDRAESEASPSPEVRAARIAAAGADVPPDVLARITSPAVLDLVAGFGAERAGDDATAEACLRRALAAPDVPDDLRARAESAIARIIEGCPAWRDRGLPALPR